MHPPDAGVRQLAVSSDGLALAVGTKRGGLAVVDLHTPELSLVAPPLPAAHESDITCLNFSPLPRDQHGSGQVQQQQQQQQRRQSDVPQTPSTPWPGQRPLLVTGGRDKHVRWRAAARHRKFGSDGCVCARCCEREASAVGLAPCVRALPQRVGRNCVPPPTTTATSTLPSSPTPTTTQR